MSENMWADPTQWEAKSITPIITISDNWGLTPENKEIVLRFFKAGGIESADGRITFKMLKLLVDYFYRNDIDTVDLNKAVTRMRQRADAQIDEQLQVLRLFGYTFSDKSSSWDSDPSNMLEKILEDYNRKLVYKSAGLINLLQLVAARRVHVSCKPGRLQTILDDIPFCFTDNRVGDFILEEKGKDLLLKNGAENGQQIFSIMDGKASSLRRLFAWLMLLQIRANDFPESATLQVQENEDDWRNVTEIQAPAADTRFVLAPEHVLSMSLNSTAVRFKFIAGKEQSIRLYVVLFTRDARIYGLSKQLEKDQQEIVLDCNAFNPWRNADSSIVAAENAEYLKIFIVSGNTEYEGITSISNVNDTILYDLLTTPDRNILGTITFGLLPPAGKSLSAAEFKQVVEKIYKTHSPTAQNDPQKDRWGGRTENKGLFISASVTEKQGGLFDISLSVQSTIGLSFTGRVAFFLHNTFDEEIVYAIAKDGVASIEVPDAYEAFTVGAYTEDNTFLEIDLDQEPGFPDGFYSAKVGERFREEMGSLDANRPVLISDDRQKGRWGGMAVRNGKMLAATVRKLALNQYTVEIIIQALKGSPPFMEDTAIFLHESYGKAVRYKKPKGGLAKVTLVAFEAFTVGVCLSDGTILELDLNEEKGYPEDFYYTDKPEPKKEWNPYTVFTGKRVNTTMEGVKKRLASLLEEVQAWLPPSSKEKKLRCPLSITPEGELSLHVPGQEDLGLPPLELLTNTFSAREHDLFFDRLKVVLEWLAVFNFRMNKRDAELKDCQITVFRNTTPGNYYSTTFEELKNPFAINNFMHGEDEAGILHEPACRILVHNGGSNTLYISSIIMGFDYTVKTKVYRDVVLAPGQQEWISAVGDNSIVNDILKVGLSDSYEQQNTNVIYKYLRIFISYQPQDLDRFRNDGINNVKGSASRKLPANSEEKTTPFHDLARVETIGFRIIKPLRVLPPNTNPL